jgi:hypothetical protein
VGVNILNRGFSIDFHPIPFFRELLADHYRGGAGQVNGAIGCLTLQVGVEVQVVVVGGGGLEVAPEEDHQATTGGAADCALERRRLKALESNGAIQSG